MNYFAWAGPRGGPAASDVVKLSNQSGPNAPEAIRIYGERVLPKLRG